MDIGMGVRYCWRRATRDTSGICWGRLSCRRQRGDASTQAFGSARGKEPEPCEKAGTTNIQESMADPFLATTSSRACMLYTYTTAAKKTTGNFNLEEFCPPPEEIFYDSKWQNSTDATTHPPPLKMAQSFGEGIASRRRPPKPHDLSQNVLASPHPFGVTYFP